jgi:hypothetical protein
MHIVYLKFKLQNYTNTQIILQSMTLKKIWIWLTKIKFIQTNAIKRNNLLPEKWLGRIVKIYKFIHNQQVLKQNPNMTKRKIREMYYSNRPEKTAYLRNYVIRMVS